jgi:hypothetical protein
MAGWFIYAKALLTQPNSQYYRINAIGRRIMKTGFLFVLTLFFSVPVLGLALDVCDSVNIPFCEAETETQVVAALSYAGDERVAPVGQVVPVAKSQRGLQATPSPEGVVFQDDEYVEVIIGYDRQALEIAFNVAPDSTIGTVDISKMVFAWVDRTSSQNRLLRISDFRNLMTHPFSPAHAVPVKRCLQLYFDQSVETHPLSDWCSDSNTTRLRLTNSSQRFWDASVAEGDFDVSWPQQRTAINPITCQLYYGGAPQTCPVPIRSYPYVSPSPTSTLTATATPTASNTPSATPTVEFTHTPSPTMTASPTPTVTPTPLGTFVFTHHDTDYVTLREPLRDSTNHFASVACVRREESMTQQELQAYCYECIPDKEPEEDGTCIITAEEYCQKVVGPMLNPDLEWRVPTEEEWASAVQHGIDTGDPLSLAGMEWTSTFVDNGFGFSYVVRGGEARDDDESPLTSPTVPEYQQRATATAELDISFGWAVFRCVAPLE